MQNFYQLSAMILSLLNYLARVTVTGSLNGSASQMLLTILAFPVLEQLFAKMRIADHQA
jgi:hypothetical protein